MALQKEHEDQLKSEASGNVKKYGSSCPLKLVGPSSSASDVDGDSSSENYTEQMDAVNVSTVTTTTPDDFIRRTLYSL